MEKKEDIERINREIAARFQRIEAAVVRAETIPALFEGLVDGIEKEFAVPFVWLTLSDAEDALPLVEAVQTSDRLKNKLRVLAPQRLADLLPHGQKPVLSNENLAAFYRLMPPSQKYFVRSVAVVPFALDGRLIGTWNNGDADADRYSADMDASLLESLAGCISRHLTKIVLETRAQSGNRSTERPGGLHG